MKITIPGQIVAQGVDAEYFPKSEMELEINNDAKMIMTIDGNVVFIADCLNSSRLFMHLIFKTRR